jgi:outer membrane protein OmpA-like peptidoglycan-associated protein
VGVAEGAPQANRTPLEVLAGGTFGLTDSLALQVGGGRGLSSGYGTPEFRVYAGARFTATRETCTGGPEDYDGFQDGDYCADTDNDGDGIPDAADRCPNDVEDRDGVLDTDGCADPDNDADGVLDDNDRCPIEPEDHDGYDDQDGCPEGDNDRDGVADARDDCPMEPEDLDSFQDDDGCPEPGPEAVVVTRTESRLLLSQRIFFDYDSDRIRSVSLPILNEVALTLRRNPDITRMRVEGYTDGQGDPQYNLDLSYRRARAVVEYLVSQGVPREHLEYQGYGSTRPVADDSTPEGQALNRRVEFTILRQAGQRGGSETTQPGDAGAGEQGGRRRRGPR